MPHYPRSYYPTGYYTPGYSPSGTVASGVGAGYYPGGYYPGSYYVGSYYPKTLAGPPAPAPSAPVTIREAVIAGLTGDAGVSSLIGPRVFPGIVPQSQLRPALAVRLLSDTPGRNLSGNDGTSTARVMFTAVSKLLSDDQAIAEAVRNFCDALTNTRLGGLPLLFCLLDPEADDYSDPGDGTGQADILTTMTYLIRYRRPVPTRS